MDPVWLHLQWPAMVATLLASWLVSSKSPRRRNAGFWVFLVSNVLWGAWGVAAAATALVVLQVPLAAMNVRGLVENNALMKKSEGR